jgi:hypothetical protein
MTPNIRVLFHDPCSYQTICRTVGRVIPRLRFWKLLLALDSDTLPPRATTRAGLQPRSGLGFWARIALG